MINSYLTEKESNTLRKFANYLLIHYDDFKTAFDEVFDTLRTGEVAQFQFIQGCEKINFKSREILNERLFCLLDRFTHKKKLGVTEFLRLDYELDAELREQRQKKIEEKRMTLILNNTGIWLIFL